MSQDPRLRILVPMDGSPEAESILRVVMRLVEARRLEVTLFGVVDVDAEAGRADTYFSRLRSRLERERVRVPCRIEEGRPVDRILEAAGSGAYDVVAMATHGRSGLSRLLIGSTTEAVLKDSPLPVLISRPESDPGDMKRLVVALDGSILAETILEDAGPLASALDASLHLLQVESPGDPGDPPGEYLKGLATRVSRQGIRAFPVRRQGEAGERILEYAGECQAGLICITTHGHGGLRDLFAGSVVRKVLRNSLCPVLVRSAAALAQPLQSNVRGS